MFTDRWHSLEIPARPHQKPRPWSVLPVVGLVVLGALLAFMAVSLVSGMPAGQPAPVSQAVTPSKPVQPHLWGCQQPAPKTAAGYKALFSKVDPKQWGAADVSISVPLSYGRSLWLYGDTFSAGRFVHSTAITQDRGCLHVSHGGAQLLPNDDATHIYWIESARADGSDVLIYARSIVLTGKGVWDFQDAGFSRIAYVRVSMTGDATFQQWMSGKIYRPAAESSPLVVVGPHHFTYALHAHPEIKLADGRELVTTAQNWDDGTLHQFADYRPIFLG